MALTSPCPLSSFQGYVLADNEIENLMRRVDFDHNGTVDLSEFITTLMDWDQVQSEQGWQVRGDAGCPGRGKEMRCGWGQAWALRERARW